MIEVHRPPDSAAADAIVAKLRQLVVAFREIEDPALDSPVVTEGEVRVAAPAEIATYLDQLQRDVAAWNAFQSDACFIGDDGEIC